MATTRRSLLSPPDLAVHTLRHHRVAVLAWVLAGGGTMWVFGAAYQTQVNSFVGGAKGFAQTVAASAEAMRALVGPADRLDTYGGYVTFHNLGYAAAMIGFWALVQGSKAIRGAEEQGQLAVWLATGRSRLAIVLDRVLAFLAAMILVTLGVGLLTWFGTIAAGEPQALRSFGALAEVSLGASVFFALSLAISQFTSSSRTSSGVTGAVMLACFLVANLGADLGGWAWLRYLSPFWYAQQSRVLVPGYDVSIGATLALVVTFAALVTVAAAAFERRDLGSAVVTRRTSAPRVSEFRVRRPWLRTLWTAEISRQRLGLAMWTLGAGAWFAMYVSVTPTILTYWNQSDLIRRLFASVPPGSLQDQYLSYVIILTAPLLTAFALVQAARWVRDSEERRTELELSCPVSRTRLWLERLFALTAGAVVVIAGSVVGLWLGGLSAGVTLRGDGLLRAAADLLLLAMAVGAVGAMTVTTLRSGRAIGALGIFLGVSFFLTVFGPMLDWPAWVIRLSVFQAFGNPYITDVALRDVGFVVGLAAAAAAATLVVSERRSAAP